jgi:hypothetical protein
LVHFYQPLFLDQAWKIVSLQIVGALCLLAAIVWVRRSLLIAGLLVVMLIEWSAYQYREYIWSFEVPLASLTIMALWPVSWTKTFSAIGGGRRPSVEANSLGRALMLYFSLAYLVCGISKLLIDPNWWKNFRNELFYPSRNITKGPLPDWLDPISAWLSRFFADHPSLSEFCCVGVLTVELLWFSSFFVPIARRTLPYFMLVSHFMFFLVSGFTFIGFALSAFAIAVPWRAFRNKPSSSAESLAPASSPPRFRCRTAFAWVAVALAVLIPVQQRRTIYPFPNFNVFGWVNRGAAEPITYYYLAFEDQSTGEVRRIPMNHAGFFDYKQWLVHGQLTNYYSPSATAPVREAALAYIHQYIRALRPHRSNRFLLGPLTMPDHVLCKSEPVDLAEVRVVYVLRYDYHYRERGLNPIASNLGALPPMEARKQ